MGIRDIVDITDINMLGPLIFIAHLLINPQLGRPKWA